MVDSEVDSLASFVRAWLASSAGIMAYAWLDLRLNPRLVEETSFTLTPDFTRVSELWDWGGRLLHHGALGLLAMNAIALGGIAALAWRGAQASLRRLRAQDDPARVSIVPASIPPSVPPEAP